MFTRKVIINFLGTVFSCGVVFVISKYIFHQIPNFIEMAILWLILINVEAMKKQ